MPLFCLSGFSIATGLASLMGLSMFGGWKLNARTVRPLLCSLAFGIEGSWMFLWTMCSPIGSLNNKITRQSNLLTHDNISYNCCKLTVPTIGNLQGKKFSLKPDILQAVRYYKNSVFRGPEKARGFSKNAAIFNSWNHRVTYPLPYLGFRQPPSLNDKRYHNQSYKPAAQAAGADPLTMQSTNRPLRFRMS